MKNLVLIKTVSLLTRNIWVTPNGFIKRQNTGQLYGIGLINLILFTIFVSQPFTNAFGQTRNQLFIIKINTNNSDGVSNSNKVFRMPMYSGSYDIDFSYNGTFDASGTGDSKLGVSNYTHLYSSPGIYEVAVRPAGSTNGTGNMRVNFSPLISGKSDKVKLVEIMEWGAGTWTSMSTAFRNCVNLVTVNAAAGTPNLSTATTMFEMFRGCTKFDANLSSWNVSNIQNFQAMFAYCDIYNNGGASLNSWNTTSATNMYQMFEYADVFNQAVGNWDVRKVTNFSRMFFRAEKFNQPLNSWNIGALVGATAINMENMFYWAYDFNQPIGNWNVSKVTNFRGMLRGKNSFTKNAFNQDLSSWTPVAGTNFIDMLDYSSLSVANYDALLISWAAQTLQSGENLGAEGLKYCAGASARQSLISSQSWSFTGDAPTGDPFCAQVWLKANDGPNTTANGANISTWVNKGTVPGTFSSLPVNAGNNRQPNYLSNNGNANFNPSINFDRHGSNALYDDGMYSTTEFLPYGPNTTRDFTIFAVNKRDNASTFGYIFLETDAALDGGGAGADYEMVSSGTIWSGSHVSGGNSGTTTAISAGARQVTGVNATGTTFINGKLHAQNTTMTTTNGIGSFANCKIGNRRTYANGLNGEIMEIIVIGSYVNPILDINFKKIQSYLALKYGISLEQAATKDYFASDGTDKIWDVNAASPGYNFDVFGIGKDDGYDLDQKVSKSQNSDGIITLATTNDFTSANSAGTRTSLSNMNFAVIANNGGGTPWNAAGAPTNFRMVGRRWQIQEEGSVGRLYVQFDVDDAQFNVPNLSQGGNYYLIVDSDNDGSYTDETPNAMINTGGSLWETSYDFTDGNRFTIAEFTGSSKAGGVDGATVWFKADNASNVALSGSEVVSWQDEITGLTVTDAMGEGNTSYDIDGMNFNPELEFDGNDALRTNLFYAPSTYSNVSNHENSSFIVTRYQSGSLIGGFDVSAAAAVRRAGDFSSSSSRLSAVYGAPARNALGTSNIVNKLIIGGSLVDNSNIRVYVDGTQEGTQTNSTPLNNDYSFRFSFGARANDLLGNSAAQIAEYINFNSKLSPTEIQQVNSYLALKYGISLNYPNGIDYYASDGTDKIWDVSAATAGFSRDIFGIGRDNSSGLNQKISKSQNADGIITLATTNDFTSPNSDVGRTSLSNLNFAVIANNDGNTFWNGSGAPADFRMVGRRWQIQEEGSVGTLYIQFDVDDPDFNVPALTKGGNYYLIVDSDNDGSYADETPKALNNTSGNLWSTSYNFNDGNRFTIGEFTGSGPGGVAGATLWLRGDQGVTSTPKITTWLDQSGASNHPNNLASAPNLITSGSGMANFNPVADFNGSHYLEWTSSIVSGYTEGEIFIVPKRVSGAGALWDFSQNDPNDEHYVWNTGRIYESWGISQRGHFHPANGGAGGDNYGGLTVQGPSVNVNKYNIYQVSSKTNEHRVYFNNKVYIEDNTVATDFATDQNYLGRKRVYNFIGDIPEVVMFNSVLSPTDKHKVNSYLALKYGITLDQGSAQDYLASDGSAKIWDASNAASGFNHDIFGIGKDAESDLDQRVSKSVNDNAIITLATTNDFTSANSDGGRSSLANLDFAVIANNGGNAAWTSAGAPSNYNILERKWQIQERTGVRAVYLQFDVADNEFNVPALTKGGTYFLLVDANNNGNFSDDDPIALTNTSGDLWSTSFDFDSGERFTLAEYVGALPGGVSGANTWFNASNAATVSLSGNNVVSWTDVVGGMVVTDADGEGNTQYDSDGFNYNPELEFDGNDALRTAGFFPSQSKFDATGQENTTFMVMRYKSGLVVGGFDQNGGTPVTRAGFFEGSGTKIRADYGTDIGSTTSSSDVSNIPVIATSTTVNLNATQSILALEINGSSETGATVNDLDEGINTRFAFGARGENLTANSTADIAEYISYPKRLSATERSKVETYLGLKYGITLSNNGGGANGDYLLSNGTTIWDASNQSSYQNQIVGIYRDDESGINQKQSKSSDDSIRVYIGSLAATNQSNGTSINNDLSSLIIGHNGAAYQALYSGPNVPSNTQKPGSIYARFERQWKVTNTNFSNSYSIRLQWDEVGNVNLADLRLLVDADGDFSNATVIASGQNGITISEGSIIISGIGTGVIPMNSTRFITIGTVSSSTPLPVSLTSFKAEKQGENNALLSWETGSEINNSHFIIERKFENGEFEFLRRVEGNGTTNEFNSYSELDVELEFGNYFYRLQQVDYDGQKEYYDIKQVVIDNSKSLEKVSYKIYPNPTNTRLNIKSSTEGQHNIIIYDNLGKAVFYQSNVLYQSSPEQIDVSNLENGMYFIQINEERIRFIIQR